METDVQQQTGGSEMDDETDWQKQLLIGLLVLVVVGALIGGIVALVSIKAADLAGIGDTAATTSSADGDTAPTEPTEPDASEPSGGPDSQPPSSDSPHTHKPPSNDGFVLTATPLSVPTYGRINLTGTYGGTPGSTLQVQRKEGGAWVDFPTTASLNGQSFSTYVETGQSGSNQFRMFDSSSGESSNTVTVQVS